MSMPTFPVGLSSGFFLWSLIGFLIFNAKCTNSLAVDSSIPKFHSIVGGHFIVSANRFNMAVIHQNRTPTTSAGISATSTVSIYLNALHFTCSIPPP